MSLYHVYTQTVADGTATSVVRPSDWNSAHAQQWVLSGNTSGSSQVSGLDVAFVGGNNVTLSADTAASKLVFSVGNYLTTAMASNAGSNFVQANATFNGTNATGTIASNAISVSVNAQSTQPVAYSAANGSANFSTLVFANSNGVSFSTGTQGLYATVKTDYLTSQTVQTQASGAIAGTGFTSTTTTGTVVVGTNSTNGLSLGIPAYITTYVNDLTSGRAGTGFTSTTTTGTAITAALGTNGLSMAVPAYITTYVAQTTQTQASGAIAGTGFTSTTTAGTAVVGTLSTNGISLGIPAYITTYVNDLTSGRAGTGFTSTTTAGTAITAALGTNGLSMAVPNFITTARASNDAIGLNTAQSNVTWTVNSSGLSLDARGYAGTGTSATNASITLNSNGLAISVVGGGTTNQTGPNIADGNGNTVTSGTVVFSNSNGVSFGLNASTMTASVNAVAVAAGGATASTGTVVFNNSNNITFGLNNGTLTASYADPYETYFIYPDQAFTTVGNPINGTASIIYYPLGHNLKASRLDFFGSVSVSTAGNTSSAAILWSATAALYSQNGNTLSSIYSTTTNSQVTWNSNTTGSVTGVRLFSVPLTISTDQGYYFLAVALSTRATGHTGAATTSLGNSISMMGIGSAQYGAFTVADFGAATTSSGNAISNGLYSGTTNFATIGLSNISFVGTFGQRAPIVVRAWST